VEERKLGQAGKQVTVGYAYDPVSRRLAETRAQRTGLAAATLADAGTGPCRYW
jgi:hypothetical protein